MKNFDRNDGKQICGTLAFLGFAQTDITPEHPVQTIGFNRADNLSRGVRDPLRAQISVWSLGEQTCCLAAVDHIGFSREHADRLRDLVGKTLSTDREHVMLCFSHTHSAPNESAEPEYFEQVCQKMTAVAAQAMQDRKPVLAGWGNAFGDIGLNRRKDSKELDRRIGILKAVDPETGKPRLMLLRLTAHANVFKRDNYLISADYFGAVRKRMEEAYGCSVMLIQGASGNVAPKYFDSVETPPDACDERFVRTKAAPECMAEEVEKQVAAVWDDIAAEPVVRLSVYGKTLPLYADVPDREAAERVVKEAWEQCGIDGVASGWMAEVGRLRETGQKEQCDRTFLQYFVLNEGCFCGVANEIMCEFALRAAAGCKNEFFYFNGYTNGCTGYFPTEEEFDQGGYEVYWGMLVYYVFYGRVYPLRRESAGQLISAAVKYAPKAFGPGLNR